MTLIERYIQFRSAKKTVKAVSTVNRELSTLRRLLRVAWRKHKLIQGTPVITLIPGETGREFVLSYDQEKAYLAMAPDTLRDFAILSLDTGVRAGEGTGLEWTDVHLEAAQDATAGYIQIRKGKSKNARRVLSMTPRVHAMLKLRREMMPDEKFVFPSKRASEGHLVVSSIDHMHATIRRSTVVKDAEGRTSELPKEFVVHSLRHTFGTRLGESGAQAFEIMRIMGHSTVTVSQKYVHPTPESLERAFARLNSMNEVMRGEAAKTLGVPTISTTAGSAKP